jgi:hypothetical protein
MEVSMNHIYTKRVAIIVIFMFVFMVIYPNYSFSQEKDEKRKSLEKAKFLHVHGQSKNALEILNRIIPYFERDINQFKNELCESYHIKAKIHYINKEFEEMEKTLRNLYEINPGYGFVDVDKEYLDFKEKAKEIKIEWEQEKKQITPPEKDKKKEETTEPEKSETKENVIEKEKKDNGEKKFPWLLLAGGVIVVVVGVVLLLSKKKTEKKTLNVTVGEGVEGTPASGSHECKKGETVSYSYSLKSGYNVLSVKLDGNEVPPGGTIKMDQDHTLTVSASKQYTLTVQKGEGVNGTPDSGTFTYNEGRQVSYNYTLQSGYSNLVVTIDGAIAPASGTITMDGNHTLNASASTGKTYQLTVQKGEGVNGNPKQGTFFYQQGELVEYNYRLQDGYENLVVTLDGIKLEHSRGTITMNRDHTLTASAKRRGECTLTVTRGDGVDGTPDSGVYNHEEGKRINYNYSLKDGYEDLVVKRDGKRVDESGTITMDDDHTLTASAKRIGDYTLIVNKGAGINGTPDSGTFTYNEGATVNYNYTLQDDYKDLVVTLDGNTVSASGTVTMNSNHTLIASATPDSSSEYTLTVSKGNGVNGTPNSGTFTYNEGETVNYNYTLQDGYKDLVVKLDGNTVGASGTITMSKNRTLNASATPDSSSEYTLTVTKGNGVNGTPNSGTFTYNEGETVNYSYTLKDGYKNLVVKLGGSTVSASGTITMNTNHTLTASATPNKKEYTLTVDKGEGVDGSPDSDTYTYNEGATVNYSYSLQSGYQSLEVKLDGNVVPASGTITMNANHTLIATAKKQWTLTVTRNDGVDGNPVSGAYTFSDGDTVNYSYSLQSGYTNLIVELDGNPVAASGSFNMNDDHTLTASATATAARKSKK